MKNFTPSSNTYSMQEETLKISELSIFKSWPDRNTVKPFTTIAILVLTLITLTHIHRPIFGWDVVIDGIVMPCWTSMIGTLISGSLAFLLWYETRWK